MRRTTPEQRRLPAPRAVLSPRSRFARLAIALPLVLGLWLTIGLPIFTELSDTAGGNGAMRDFFFDADASGATGGNGGDRGPSSPGFVAAAIVDPKIVRQVRLERLCARTAPNVTRAIAAAPTATRRGSGAGGSTDRRR